jgi:hypothetical protein
MENAIRSQRGNWRQIQTLTVALITGLVRDDYYLLLYLIFV